MKHRRIAYALFLVTLGLTVLRGRGAPVVQFELDSSSALEDVGGIPVRIVLSLPAVGGESVAVSVAGGSASSGDDYTLSGSPAVFAAGSQQAHVTISVADDTVMEGNERVVLALGSLLHLALLLGLCAVLGGKARREERMLMEVHPEYAAYRLVTPAIIPGLPWLDWRC